MNRKDLIVLGLAAAALLGGCLIESWLDRREHATARPQAHTWLALAVVLGLIGAGVFAVNRAHGCDLDGRCAACDSELGRRFDVT